ncbi:MAG TPA: glycosyl hydrolase [Steroidobacteraceae bacterium]
MMRIVATLCSVVLASCIAAAAFGQSPAQQIDQSPKRVPLGVYEKAGCDGVRGVADFKRWFGRNPDQTLEFITWQIMQEGSTWAMGCWKNAGQKSVVYSIPMLPDDNSATLAEGAAGKFDALFRNYALKLVQFGYGHAVIRLGWEFNGDWYPWAASKDPESWKAYWRRIVTAMRSAPGAHFKFDWTMAGGWTDFLPEAAYPGDEYVDIIGMDLYNIVWDKNADTPEGRWDFHLNTRRGLVWQRDFAAQHRKPISFAEWGTGKQPSGGGGDDPYFIEQMAAWIGASNTAYHNYWDHTGGFNAKLSDGHQPQSAAAFLRAFGGPKPRPPGLMQPG